MDVRVLETLFGKGEYAACKAVGLELVYRPDLMAGERALVAYYLSWCCSQQSQYDEALGYGDNAVMLSRVAGEWNMLGKALLQSGYVLARVGLNRLALARFQEYFRYADRYGEETARLYGNATFNIGVAYRKIGRHDEAVQHLAAAWEWAQQHMTGENEQQEAQLWRSTYAWQLLLVGRLAEAEAVIAAGEAYANQQGTGTEGAMSHRLDQAQLAFLSGDCASAVEKSMEVLSLPGDNFAWLRARAALILHHVAERLHMRKDAFGMGLLAKSLAYAAERLDIVEEVNQSLHKLQGPTVVPEVEEVLRDMGELPQALRRRSAAGSAGVGNQA